MRHAGMRIGGRALRAGVELVAHAGAHEQLGRHVHPGGGARIRFSRNGAAQPDHQPVLLGEPADHEQTHVPRGVGRHLATGLQARVGDAQIGFGHAEPDVADLDDQPTVSGVHGRHPHLRNRRRVAQRVVEQLGEQVHEVARDRSDDLAVGHRRGDDAGVVLDLGGRGVDEGRDGHRVGLLARHLRAGEHQQVGAVSAHPCGQVIEPEQALQPLRVLLVALQPVDERELLVDQRAAAPRQRLEHVADLQLQPALLAGQEDGLLVQLVDGVGDLADFLGGVHRDRLDGSGFLA